MAEFNQGLIYILAGMIMGGILFFVIARLFRRRVPVIQSSGEAFSEQEVEGFLKRPPNITTILNQSNRIHGTRPQTIYTFANKDRKIKTCAFLE